MNLQVSKLGVKLKQQEAKQGGLRELHHQKLLEARAKRISGGLVSKKSLQPPGEQRVGAENQNLDGGNDDGAGARLPDGTLVLSILKKEHSYLLAKKKIKKKKTTQARQKIGSKRGSKSPAAEKA